MPRTRRRISLVLVAVCGALAACVHENPLISDLAQANLEKRGAALFAENCADCHGAHGEGSKDAPAIVGPGALPRDPRPGARKRTGRFDTIDDISRFVRTSMPADAPGLLSSTEYDAVVAYCLSANQLAARDRH